MEWGCEGLTLQGIGAHFHNPRDDIPKSRSRGLVARHERDYDPERSQEITSWMSLGLEILLTENAFSTALQKGEMKGSATLCSASKIEDASSQPSFDRTSKFESINRSM